MPPSRYPVQHTDTAVFYTVCCVCYVYRQTCKSADRTSTIPHYNICRYYATQKELPPDTGLGLFTISSRQSSTEFHFQMTFIDSAALPWRNCKQSEPGVTGYFFLGRIVVTRSPNHLSAYSLSIKEIISWFILLSLLSVQPTYFLLFVSYLHVCISYPHISSFSW